MTTREEALLMIEDCAVRSSKLTDWECDFIDSLSERVGRGLGLTDKQLDTLERIWNSVTE